MLDPLSALSVAAAVVQFLEFGTKLISKQHEIYKSADGRLVEHAHIRAATNSLTDQCKVLRSHVRREDFKQDPIPGEEGLTDILRRSLQVAEELLCVVDELRVTGVGKAFKSFRNAFKTLWSKERIQKMVADLNDLRAELMMSLLIVMREEHSLDVQKLIKINKTMEGTILSTVRQVASTHEKQISNLHESMRSGWLFRTDKKAKINAANAWLSNNQEIVSEFNSDINQETASSTDYQIRIKIRDNLCFNEIFQRYDEIPDAEVHTFGWIYDGEEIDNSAWSSFGQWLRESKDNSANMYWISGKPGSGKSTLMRYLCKNARTLGNLKSWANSSDILLASCFLWNPGTELQKSQQGLLRTLLFQLLIERPDFPASLFPKRWQLLALGSESQYAWSDDELEHAITTFVDHFGQRSRIILFVDGLDEYDGSEEQRQHICDMLHELARNDAIKICVSSRPWNIYIDAFRHDPKLRLEDLTKSDIRKYVDQTLDKSPHFQLWSSKEWRQSEELRATIVSKAQGVFLWVRLVTNSLMKSLRANDDAYDLTRRLAELPTELEDYFQRMVDSMEKFYLEDAACMFEVARRPNTSLMTYYYTHALSVENCLFGPAKKLSLEDVLIIQENEDRRINARCMGLLESFSPNKSATADPKLRLVDFLHRTAKDYIMSNAIQQKMKTWQTKPFDSALADLESYVCQLKSCDIRALDPWMSHSRFLDLLQMSMVRIKDIYRPGDDRSQLLVQEIKEAFDSLLVISGDPWKVGLAIPTKFDAGFEWSSCHREVGTDFLAWAITYGFEAYVFECLKDMDASQIKKPTKRPYLDYAVRPMILEARPLTGITPTMSHFRIVQRLLRLQADPNFVWNGNTIWGHFLEVLAPSSVGRPILLDKSTPVFLIMREFITYGAVDTVRNASSKNDVSTRSRSFVRTVSPWKVIRTAFEPDAAKELVTLLNGSSNGSIAAKTSRLIARIN